MLNTTNQLPVVIIIMFSAAVDKAKIKLTNLTKLSSIAVVLVNKFLLNHKI